MSEQASCWWLVPLLAASCCYCRSPSLLLGLLLLGRMRSRQQWYRQLLLALAGVVFLPLPSRAIYLLGGICIGILWVEGGMISLEFGWDNHKIARDGGVDGSTVLCCLEGREPPSLATGTQIVRSTG
jgi:hypothetical protein